ncbi:GNAT family N-acetyltransferase [Nitratireductor sp. XY-223]|uniref:GNAT family N-acetyltransferase n=1 Tax=Nitratireductor sp. XY-223 TaxID=2561926 RepID=UPI0010AB2DEB|nr:GNAT family N-acetyltransferase [Nitratireductor sp. XY-223]
MTCNQVEYLAVDNTRWTDLEALFEARGGPHYCWCMAWRRKPADKGKASLKAALRAQVSEGTPIGIIAYAEKQPVAWCSVAPRPSYRKLGGPGDHEGDGSVWSIACFFVKREFRGQGMTEGLIGAAIAEARQRGAGTIEAYPVEKDSPSYGFMGRVPAFEKAGFRHVGRAGKWRRVMRLSLS